MRRVIAYVVIVCVFMDMSGCIFPSESPEEAGPEQDPTVAPEIVNWLQENAIPFNTAEPGSGFDDLMPLKEVIGDARIVALGEATHGTSEFFKMKHRMLEFLVKEMGFTIFAIEASWPESNLVNDYVHTGEGDPEKLLAGLHFWTWNTQEVLDMIEWMQDHNEDPGTAPLVDFTGFDMQFPVMAMDAVISYVQDVDSDAVSHVDSLYADFYSMMNDPQGQSNYLSESESVKNQYKKNVKEVYDFLVDHKAAYEAASSSEEFVFALQNALICVQAADVYAGPGARDKYMAENVTWLLDQAGPDSKMVIWAHNGHVMFDTSYYEPMGSYLKEVYGDEMVVFGFMFYSGSFNAVTMVEPNQYRGLTEHEVEEPPTLSYEYYFKSAQIPHLFLDLREIQPSPGTDWLLESHSFRSIGAVYSEDEASAFFWKSILSEVFDVIIYFEETSPSHLLGRRTVLQRRSSPSNLSFETGTEDWILAGSDSHDYEIMTDSTIVYSGKNSGYIHSVSEKISGFGTLMQSFRPDEYRGKRVRMSAYVRTRDVSGWAGLWMRVDGPSSSYSFDNMSDRPIQGSTDWTLYEIILDVPEDSVSIAFGILIEGTGHVWVDGVEFEIVTEDVPTTDKSTVI